MGAVHLTEIELAIEEELDSLKVENGGYLKQLESISTRPDEELMAGELILSYPAILINFDGSPIDRAGNSPHYDMPLEFTLYLLDASLRGDKERRRGSSVTGEPPGLYKMFEDVLGLLDEKMLVNPVLIVPRGPIRFHGRIEMITGMAGAVALTVSFIVPDRYPFTD